jgi:UDP-glucose 4-epimerase
MIGRILVTGATGFLGLPLVARLLADGERVTALARSFEGVELPEGVDRLVADLTSVQAVRAAFRRWRWDAVVSLAGPVPRGVETFERGTSTATAHVNIALHLLRALPRGFGGRVVHTSSMTVYGQPESIPVSEDAPRRPMHLYGLGKALADEVLVNNSDAFDLWILRLPGLFASWRKGGALYHFARAAVRGEPLRITASEPVAWDVLDVRDAIEAISRALVAEEHSPGAVNVSYGEPVELVAMARRIAEMAGRGSEVIVPEGVTHPVFQLDITRARKLLAWPPTTLEARLRELLDSVEKEDGAEKEKA